MAPASDHIADPVLARLLRFKTSLQAGGSSDGYDILATYVTRSGDKPFAICRDGLLIAPGSNPRFIPFVQIEDAGYYNEPNVRRAKKVKETGSDVSEPLTILLDTGEAIDLPVEVREDGMPDMLTIANFIQQRSTIYKTEQRRTQKT